MDSSLQQLVVQWQQTPRLRFGVLIVCGTMALYLVLVLADYRDQSLTDARSELVRLNKVQGLSKQDYWLERAEQARAIRIRFESQLWKAESRGLAQASLQTWFTRSLGSLKLSALVLDTELAADVPGSPGLWQVTADLKGAISRAQLVNLLKLLEANERLITVEHLKLVVARKGLNMHLQLRAWFLGADEGPAGSQRR